MLNKLYIVMVALVAAFSLSAQSVDDILNNYFENTGGLENWHNLKSTRTEATMSMGGMEFQGIIFAKFPNKQRVEVDVQGQKIIQSYDGETAWWINPFASGPEAQPMPDEMAEDMKKQEFENPFINYREKESKVELLGEELVEGTETFKVRLTKKDGSEETYFFDKEYFIPVMIQSLITSGQAQGQMTEIYFSDYQEVEGLMMPFFLETKVGAIRAEDHH